MKLITGLDMVLFEPTLQKFKLVSDAKIGRCTDYWHNYSEMDNDGFYGCPRCYEDIGRRGGLQGHFQDCGQRNEYQPEARYQTLGADQPLQTEDEQEVFLAMITKDEKLLLGHS